MFSPRSITNLQALITTPLPSQFLAIWYLWLLLCLCMCNCLILFWKDFTSLAGFYTILLICPNCYLSLLSVCAFCFGFFFFHHPDPSHTLFVSFLGCIVLVPLKAGLSGFAHSVLGVLFPAHTLNSVFMSPRHGVIDPVQRTWGLALQLWTHHRQQPLSTWPIKDQGRCVDGAFLSSFKSMLLKITLKCSLKCVANTPSLSYPGASKEFRVWFTCLRIFLGSTADLLSQTLGEQASSLCLINIPNEADADVHSSWTAAVLKRCQKNLRNPSHVSNTIYPTWVRTLPKNEMNNLCSSCVSFSVVCGFFLFLFFPNSFSLEL